jgi:tRNA G37 N-methylase TrmD
VYRHAVASAQARHRGDEVFGAGDLVFVDLRDDIVRLKPRVLRRAALDESEDEDAVACEVKTRPRLVRQRAGAHADEGRALQLLSHG